MTGPPPLRPRCAGLLTVAFVFAVALTTSSGRSAEPTDFAATYTKSEFRIPMRDGIRLYTSIYTPKDTSTQHPILLIRTPYGQKPYTIDNPSQPDGLPDSYVRERFIFAIQDVRGRYASEGDFVDVRPLRPRPLADGHTDEATDAYDTIDWLVRSVPHHNGNVGMQGISYPGFFAAVGMVDSHPALKAVSPQAPVADLYDGDDALHNGCFWLIHNFGFIHYFNQPVDDPTRDEPRPFDFKTPDGYRFFLDQGPLANLDTHYFKGKAALWNDLVHHSADAAWTRARNITPHLRNVHAAVLTVGGWYDAEDLSGTLKTYRAVEAQNPGIFNGLVMGPWSHGAWHYEDGDRLGPISFRSKSAPHFRDEIEVPFFRRFLKGDTNVTLAEAYVFETGTCRWRQESAWPPADAVVRNLYLGAGGRLAFEPASPDSGGYDEFTSDPAKPVPYTAQIGNRMNPAYMVEDQRFVATRPDVLVYQSEPLAENLTVAGPISVRLHVSTTGTDADWIVKLIDVFTPDHPDPDPNPSGLRMGAYQQLVRGEPFRGKYRAGYDRPAPITPGDVTDIEFTMPDVCHTFRAGHRIMVQVQSSWFPLSDRNPQTFVDVFQARPEDFRKATHRVYHGPPFPSSLTVLTVPAKP